MISRRRTEAHRCADEVRKHTLRLFASRGKLRALPDDLHGHVHGLPAVRRKLGESLIKTVRGGGYVFTAPVEKA